MKRTLITLLAAAALSLTASAQSLVGIWRWNTEPGSYKFLEFKQNGKVSCRDYATFTTNAGNTLTVTGWICWEASYTHKGNTLTFVNQPSTAKAKVVGLKVTPEVPQKTYNKIKSSIVAQLNQAAKANISSKPENYTIESFSKDRLQMLVGDDTAQYIRVKSYTTTE